jgi:hypothetical protein
MCITTVLTVFSNILLAMLIDAGQESVLFLKRVRRLNFRNRLLLWSGTTLDEQSCVRDYVCFCCVDNNEYPSLFVHALSDIRRITDGRCCMNTCEVSVDDLQMSRRYLCARSWLSRANAVLSADGSTPLVGDSREPFAHCMCVPTKDDDTNGLCTHWYNESSNNQQGRGKCACVDKCESCRGKDWRPTRLEMCFQALRIVPTLAAAFRTIKDILPPPPRQHHGQKQQQSVDKPRPQFTPDLVALFGEAAQANEAVAAESGFPSCRARVEELARASAITSDGLLEAGRAAQPHATRCV